jgi:copper chaperone CopZ
MVKRVTLESLLRHERLADIAQRPYFVCRTAGCETVYFSEGDGQAFVKSDLALRFGLKETESPRPVCYCFDHSAEEIEDEIRRTGRSSVVEQIKAAMKGPGCRCEYTNPLGCCCLISVQEVVAHALRHAGRAPEAVAVGDADRGDCRDVWEHASERGTATDCCAAGRQEENHTAAVIRDCRQPHSAVAASPRRDRAGPLAAGGSVLAAILSSACCWFPLLLVALGVSAAGVAGFFEAYRLYFIVGAVSLLGVGFYAVYFRKATCEPGSACAPPNRKPRAINQVTLWAATVLVAALAFFPNYVGHLSGAMSQTSGQSDDVRLASMEFRIEGMTCEGCANILHGALTKLSGVKAAEVDFTTKTAVVRFEEDRPLPAEQVIEAAIAGGYTATFSGRSQ